MKALPRYIFYLSIALLIAGCWGGASYPSIPSPTAVLSTQSISSPSQAVPSRAPEIPPEETSTPPAIISSAPQLTQPLQEDQEIPSCVGDGIPIKPPQGFGINGAIVYRDKNGHGLYLVGGTPLVYSHLQVPLDQEYVIFGFSPDGKWLAYSPITWKPGLNAGEDLSQPRIYLLSFDGEIKVINVDIDPILSLVPSGAYLYSWTGYPFSWVNDHIIMIIFNYVWGNRIKEFPAFYDVSQQTWRNDLYLKLPGKDIFSGIGISPDMTRALYTLFNSGEPQGIVLWDENRQTDIGHYTGFIPDWTYARWSSDSSHVAFLARNQDAIGLYLMDRDGTNIEQINSPMVDSKPVDINIFGIYWSPNSRYLAIDARVKSGIQGILYIFDIRTMKYIYRCQIHNKKNINYLWSMDNQSIASTSYDRPDEPMIVYDLATKKVIQLVDKASAGGWSAEFVSK